MQKAEVLILGVLILLLSTTSTSAKVKMIDVVHLEDGSIATGEIIATTPNKTIKIKSIDGPLITYSFNQIEKIDRVEVEFKNRTTATVCATIVPIFPAGLLSFLYPVFSGWGQFYNGQPLKAVAFLANGFIGASTFVGGAYSDDNTIVGIGAGMVLGGYILSIIDANLSAKKINDLSNQKINAMKLKNYQPKDVSTSLNYLPNQGLTAALNFGF